MRKPAADRKRKPKAARWRQITNSQPKLLLFKRKIESPGSCNSLGIRLCTIETHSLFSANIILRHIIINVNKITYINFSVPTTENSFSLLNQLFTRRFLEFPSLRRFLDANRNRHCHTNHWVITSADKPHHLNMCRYGRRTRELSVRMLT